MAFNQHSIFFVSSVQFSLQSFSPSIPAQPEVPVGTPSTLPPDLVKGDESPGQRTVEVAIPHVGTFVIESEEGGYDDEVAFSQTNLLPVWHMQWEHHCLITLLHARFFTPEKSDTFCPMIAGLTGGWKCFAIRLAAWSASQHYSCVKSLFLRSITSWHKGSLSFCGKLGPVKKRMLMFCT